MRKLTMLWILAVLFAAAISAQNLDTPAGRQFSAWLTAFNSGDRAVMQQFFDKSRPFGRIDQDMTFRSLTGGFDVKKIEQLTETQVIVLVQERAPAQQFRRITMTVDAQEPYQVRGLRFGPAEP